jgi:hypothetical protein
MLNWKLLQSINFPDNTFDCTLFTCKCILLASERKALKGMALGKYYEYLNKIWCVTDKWDGGIYWIDLAQNTDRWQVPENVLMIL